MSDSTLPIDPRTGLRAVMVLPNGRVVWPVLGGSGEGGDPPDPAGDGGDGTPDPEPPAAPAGSEKDWQAEADKWKALARKHETSAKSNADKAKKFDELEESQKSEQQKLADQLEAARAESAKATAAQLRLEVALEKAPEGMSVAQIRKLARRLTGSTQEELEADAEELFADFAPSDDGKDDKSGPPSRKPKENLRGGNDPDEPPDETDPSKLAALIPRR